jgi:phage baseplate assembly protein V
MFDIAELKRKLKNIVRVTSIVTPNIDGKALATIKIGKSESIEFPVVSFANSFKKHWIPIRANEQVVVVFPLGNANKGFIFRGIFWKKLKEPKGADGDTEIVEYEDGTRISYSTKDNTLKVEGNCKIVIEVKDVTIKAENVKVEADKVEIKSNKIELGGAGGMGVITEKSICPFTKSPHTNGSTVTSST